MEDQTDRDEPLEGTSILSWSVQRTIRVLEGARSALRWGRSTRIHRRIRGVLGGIVGATRFLQTNTLRGLLAGEMILSECTINRWLARVEPPVGVASIEVRCRPSRLILVLRYDRRVLGVPMGSELVELPFEIKSLRLDHEGGYARLGLDREASPPEPEKGLLRSLTGRLLSRATADLLDHRTPLERLDQISDVIWREGDIVVVDVGRYPPYRELMNRELKLIGGKPIFPFRALVVQHAQVREGKLVISVQLDHERIVGEPIIDVETDEEFVEVKIV